jgi:DNA-binding CsgD family transcriptional regulator
MGVDPAAFRSTGISSAPINGRSHSGAPGGQQTADLSPRASPSATRVVAELAQKSIAAQLDISVEATSTYLTRAQRKLG